MTTNPTQLRSLHRLSSLLVVFVLAGLISACDSPTADIVDEVTVSGTVTNAPGFATDESWQGVEGATVRAYAVGANGDLRALDGEAITDPEGRYTLTTEATDRPVRIEAVSGAGDIHHATVIEAGGAMNRTVDASPMTAESTVQADVYDHLLATDPNASIADVHALVGEGGAASVSAGHTTVADLATAIRSGVEAERAFAMSPNGGGIANGAADEARVARDLAYTDFRTQAAAATSADARREAEDAFVDAYVRGYGAAGLTPMQQSHAAATGAAATGHFAGTTNADAAYNTAYRSRSLAALSTSYGIEDEFRTGGASETGLGALSQARTAHYDALRGATTDAQFAEANRTYQDAVSTELATHGGFTSAQIDDAFAATSGARADLDTGVQGATDAAGIADAYGAYYPAASSAAHESLGGVAGEQSLGGGVVGTLGTTAQVP